MALPKEVSKNFLWMLGIGAGVLTAAILWAKSAAANASKVIQLASGGVQSVQVNPGQTATLTLPSGATWISLALADTNGNPFVVAPGQGATAPITTGVIPTGTTATGVAVWGIAGTTQSQVISIACVQA